jgi:hypothetical protein
MIIDRFQGKRVIASKDMVNDFYGPVGKIWFLFILNIINLLVLFLEFACMITN